VAYGLCRPVPLFLHAPSRAAWIPRAQVVCRVGSVDRQSPECSDDKWLVLGPRDSAQTLRSRERVRRWEISRVQIDARADPAQPSSDKG
jgi:hypothetical protein